MEDTKVPALGEQQEQDPYTTSYWTDEANELSNPRYRSLRVPDLPFLPTRSYAAFCLLCDTCATYGYSAIVTGEAGVGKTRAAAQYADRWLHAAWGFGPDVPAHPAGSMHGPPLHAAPRSLVYAPYPFPKTTRALATDLLNAITACERWGGEGWGAGGARDAVDASLGHASTARGTLHLLIVDDADTWASRALAHVLDVCRERNLGVILLGSPALRRRLDAMRALSRQVNYWFTYQPLLAAEVRAIVTWTMVAAVSPHHRPEHAPLQRFWTAANTLIGLGGRNMRVLRSLLQCAAVELVLSDSSSLSRTLIPQAAARWRDIQPRPHLPPVRYLPLPLPLAQPLPHSC